MSGCLFSLVLGKIEPALRGLKREYRSLVVHKNYKVIYYIDDDMVFIASFWMHSV